MTRTYRIVSGCSRLDLPPERWTGRLPAKWRDRVPHHVALPGAANTILIDHWPLHTIGQTWVNGWAYDQTDSGPSIYDRPGTGSPAQRVREQDQDEVDAEVLYTDPYSPIFLEMVASQDIVGAEMMCAHPIFAGFWRGVRVDEGYRALIRAYNSFLAEEYCAAAPSRLIAIGVIPDTGVDDAIAEMTHCTRVGLKGVALHRFPSGRGYPTPEDDRFWRAALETNTPVTFLAHGGTSIFAPEGPLVHHPRRPGDGPASQDAASPLPRFAFDRPMAPLQMAVTGVFDRFPQLRIYWAGTRAGLPPGMLAQIDDHNEQTHYWRGRSADIQPLVHPPSFYLKTNCLWGFTSDLQAVETWHLVGTSQLIWGSGFGAPRSYWPHSRHVIERCFGDVPETEQYPMLAGNVAEFFHLWDDVRQYESPLHNPAYAR